VAVAVVGGWRVWRCVCVNVCVCVRVWGSKTCISPPYRHSPLPPHPRGTSQVYGLVEDARGGVSGGTIASAMNVSGGPFSNYGPAESVD
jgi:hypothetical protein